jgi:hypothetical protein
LFCIVQLELDNKQPFYIFGCGLLAGGLASFITQPFDVIKTSQQLSKEKLPLIDAIIIIKRVGIHYYCNSLLLIYTIYLFSEIWNSWLF